MHFYYNYYHRDFIAPASISNTSAAATTATPILLPSLQALELLRRPQFVPLLTLLLLSLRLLLSLPPHTTNIITHAAICFAGFQHCAPRLRRRDLGSHRGRLRTPGAAESDRPVVIPEGLGFMACEVSWSWLA